jgi:hypothetical protein
VAFATIVLLVINEFTNSPNLKNYSIPFIIAGLYIGRKAGKYFR